MRALLLLIIFFASTLTHAQTPSQVHKDLTPQELREINQYIMERMGRTPKMFNQWESATIVPVKLTRAVASLGRVDLHFDKAISRISIREELLDEWQKAVRDSLGAPYIDAHIGFYAGDVPLQRYIPNFFRDSVEQDAKRLKNAPSIIPLVRRLDNKQPTQGLWGRQIALWPSHGYYYDNKEDKWMLQRPALYGTIEDIHSYLYTNEYLIPMLEKAGAVVFSPRDRDTSRTEIIIDRDRSRGAKTSFTSSEGFSEMRGGFMWKDTLGEGDNPFEDGKYLLSPPTGGQVRYSAKIKHPATHAVYVSYKAQSTNSSEVLYTIKSGSQTYNYAVNQRMGGGWVFLDRIPMRDSVELSVSSEEQFSVDAVKIGGGMGNVKRGENTSGKPRWSEAARYFMQYSGVDSTIFVQKHDPDEPSDYKDDYKSRGDWVNYLINKQRSPIDASITLHSNAGIVDSIYGTLTIHYTKNGEASYRDKRSKYSGRDYSDLIQSQIVDDLRALFDTTWTEGPLFDKGYAEVSRPDVPATIVEMFSHQNLKDMYLGLQPKVRFAIARAAYKGILKFLAHSYDVPYRVAPLPVKNITLNQDSHNFALSWKSTPDSLEPSARTTGYRIGRAYQDTSSLNFRARRDGKHHRIEITAINSGGESLPTTALEYAAFPIPKSYTMIIKDFDHSLVLDTLTSYPTRRGIVIDPLRFTYDDYSIVGEQIDFEPSSQFIDNDKPGWGASSRDWILNGVVSPATTLIERFTRTMRKLSMNYIVLEAGVLKEIPSSTNLVLVVTNRNKELVHKHYSQMISPSMKLEVMNLKEASVYQDKPTQEAPQEYIPVLKKFSFMPLEDSLEVVEHQTLAPRKGRKQR